LVLKLKHMKKHFTLLVAIVSMMILGASLGYAAFPVTQKAPAQNGTTATSQSQHVPALTTAVATETKGGGGKSQLVALILCGVVGYLGIHRFYLGYIWQGIVQLLTAGLCGIWTLIDFIRILTGDLVPKDGSYDQTL